MFGMEFETPVGKEQEILLLREKFRAEMPMDEWEDEGDYNAFIEERIADEYSQRQLVGAVAELRM